MNEYKQYTIKEMREAMEASSILKFENGCSGFFDDNHNYGPFVYLTPTGKASRMDGAWTLACIILPKKETRYMTQAEVIAFVVNTPGCVVRMKGDFHWSVSGLASYRKSEDLEWTTCTIDGIYGDPHEFTKEI